MTFVSRPRARAAVLGAWALLLSRCGGNVGDLMAGRGATSGQAGSAGTVGELAGNRGGVAGGVNAGGRGGVNAGASASAGGAAGTVAAGGRGGDGGAPSSGGAGGGTGVPPVAGPGALPERWWTKLNGEREFGPRKYAKKLRDITALIPILAAQGYRIVNPSAWGVHVAAPDAPYWGFVDVVDYYHVDPVLGTDDDWSTLTRTAHERGMAVNCWFQLASLHKSSTPGQQIVADVKTYGWQKQKLPAASPARWVLLTNDQNSPHPSACDWFEAPEMETASQPKVYYCWHYSRATFSTDFSDPGWRQEAKKILRHWVDTGVDGFVFDDPSGMLNVSEASFREIVDDLHAYRPNVAIGGELGCCRDNVAAGFTILNSSRPEETNPIFDRIEGSGGDVDGFARSRDASETGGLVGWAGLHITGWSSPDPGHAKGLLEVAGLAGIGMVVHHAITIDSTDYQYGDFGTWPDEDGPKLAAILNLVNGHPALAPAALRRTVSAKGGYAALRAADPTAAKRVLAVFNFNSSAQVVSLDLTGAGIVIPQSPVDLGHGAAPRIAGTSYDVPLPAYGYAFYEVEWDGKTPWKK